MDIKKYEEEVLQFLDKLTDEEFFKLIDECTQRRKPGYYRKCRRWIGRNGEPKEASDETMYPSARIQCEECRQEIIRGNKK